MEWSWRVSILRDQIGQRYIRTPAGTLGLQNQLEINLFKVFGKLELGSKGIFSPPLASGSQWVGRVEGGQVTLVVMTGDCRKQS